MSIAYFSFQRARDYFKNTLWSGLKLLFSIFGICSELVRSWVVVHQVLAFQMFLYDILVACLESVSYFAMIINLYSFLSKQTFRLGYLLIMNV